MTGSLLCRQVSAGTYRTAHWLSIDHGHSHWFAPGSNELADAPGQIGAQRRRGLLSDRLSVSLMPTGPDPSSAGPLQSGREDPPGCRAGELNRPRGLERAGRGPSGSGQRRGRHRVLPDRPGAGGQQPRCALHHHPPCALSRSPPPSPPLRPRRGRVRHPEALRECAIVLSELTKPTPNRHFPHAHFCCFRQPNDRFLNLLTLSKMDYVPYILLVDI